MSNQKSIFVCKECGNEYLTWQGQCIACQAWDSLTEMKVSEVKRGGLETRTVEIQDLSQIDLTAKSRLQTGFQEIDQVLGGGMVPGSLILLGGEPGVGKSTLLLQLSQNLPACLYVSAEESSQQVGLRALRLGIELKRVKYLCTSSLEQAVEAVSKAKAKLVVIDSVQSIASDDLSVSAGSVAQVKQIGLVFQRLAKETGITVVLIGHVTKEGQIAGPKILEHLVDVVIYLEGEKMGSLRLLRCTKNRFGTVNEVGVLEMTEKGLEAVANPSEHFLREREKGTVGSVVSCTMEGLRPILIEVQALCHRTSFGYPKRTSQGFDANRLSLIAAILQSQTGINLNQTDLYLNVVGGIKIKEVGVDTAVAMAIVSSHKKKPVSSRDCFFGELGLTGEIRQARFHKKRLQEAKSLGFNFKTAKSIRDLIGSIF
jgi:DNA repair protein RadA/Sms